MAENYFHRERARKILNHQEADRVAMDLGSMNNSTIHIDAYNNLLDYLGIDKKSIEEPILDKSQQVVLNVDHKVLEVLDVDFDALWVNPPDKRYNSWEKEDKWSDEWGIVWRKHKGCYYYDPVPEMAPLRNMETIEEIQRYSWPDPDDDGRYRGLREKAKDMDKNGSYSIVGNVMISIICWPWYLRGLEKGLMDLAENRKLKEALVDIQTEVWLKMALNFLREVGDYIDVLIVYQDDYDGQFGPIIPPGIWSDIVIPKMRYCNEKIKRRIWRKDCFLGWNRYTKNTEFR